MKKSSEFGKGRGYCLGLFLAHTEMYQRQLKAYKSIEAEMKKSYPDYNYRDEAAGMFFYGASDHLYEFEISDVYSTKFIKRAKKFRTFVMGLRLSRKATEKDYHWAIKEAKELLRLLDEEHGIKTIKADWD